MSKAGVGIFLMLRCLNVAYAGLRRDVQVIGTTVGPNFARKSETASLSCPESHPHPFDGYSQCCADKFRISSNDCPGSAGGDAFLIGDDPPACCSMDRTQQCPHSKCKMNSKGFEHQAHVVLIGNTGTFDWNFGQNGRRFPNLLPWPQGANNFFMQQQAVEYPPESMQIVVCGGTDVINGGIWWTTNACHQFDLVNNVWSTFASLRTSAHSGVLKEVGGTLFSLGGHHRNEVSRLQLLLKSTERYVDSTASWVQGHDMPMALDYFAAEVLNSQEMILAGGYNNVVTNVDKVYLFNPFTGAYVEKAPLAFGRRSLGSAKISLDGGQSTGIVFFGGITSGNPPASHDIVEIFKVEDNSYIRGDHLKFPGGNRFVDGQMVSVDGTVFLFGARSIHGHGDNNDDAYRELWKFQGVDSNPTWTLETAELPKVATFGVTNAVVVKDKEPYSKS